MGGGGGGGLCDVLHDTGGVDEDVDGAQLRDDLFDCCVIRVHVSDVRPVELDGNLGVGAQSRRRFFAEILFDVEESDGFCPGLCERLSHVPAQAAGAACRDQYDFSRVV